jgi:hypothetical protein
MSKRNLILIVVLALAGGSAVYVFKDWLKPEPIQIAYTVRPIQPSRNPAPTDGEYGEYPPSGKAGYNVTFAFNQKLNLTAVKVFSLQDAMTNKYPYPLWNLVSDSNTPPVKSLIYGAPIPGLRPSVKGATADPLEAGGSYRLVIIAGDVKTEKDFHISH